MRGRRPETMTIAGRDQDGLHWVAHSGSSPWFQVQRAKIILAVAAGNIPALLRLGSNVTQPPSGGPVSGIAGAA
jgi:hypothetical protein